VIGTGGTDRFAIWIPSSPNNRACQAELCSWSARRIVYESEAMEDMIIDEA